jgi:hypothetical protein
MAPWYTGWPRSDNVRRLSSELPNPPEGSLDLIKLNSGPVFDGMRSTPRWGRADADTLKASLLTDIHAANHPKRISKAEYTDGFVNPALERLRLYFPDTYAALEGDDLQKRKEFERQET